MSLGWSGRSTPGTPLVVNRTTVAPDPRPAAWSTVAAPTARQRASGTVAMVPVEAPPDPARPARPTAPPGAGRPTARRTDTRPSTDTGPSVTADANCVAAATFSAF